MARRKLFLSKKQRKKRKLKRQRKKGIITPDIFDAKVVSLNKKRTPFQRFRKTVTRASRPVRGFTKKAVVPALGILSPRAANLTRSLGAKRTMGRAPARKVQRAKLTQIVPTKKLVFRAPGKPKVTTNKIRKSTPVKPKSRPVISLKPKSMKKPVFNPRKAITQKISGGVSFGKQQNQFLIPFFVIVGFVLVLIIRPFGLFSK